MRFKNKYSFLRWAGSKQRLLDNLKPYFGLTFSRYHEPFLGGGNVFLNLVPSGTLAYLSDLNEELINCFTELKENPTGVVQCLKKYKNTKDEYLIERNRIYLSTIEKAAKFIYVNRTCYNGIFRVNSKGLFNVPYGYRINVDIVTEDLLYSVSERLKDVTLFSGDFAKSLNNIGKGDLVFLDPPYTLAHQNNGFVEYNQQIFSWQDQQRLYRFIEEISARGAYFVLTNAAHASISSLYEPIGSPFTVERFSLIGGKGAKRSKVNEYIFSNLSL